MSGSPSVEGGERELPWRKREFSPTVAKPIPSIRCQAIARSTGEQCKRAALRGAEKCPKHYGFANIAGNVKAREAVLEHARLRLIYGSDSAVDALLELVESAPPAVRLKAAEAVLDRVGIRGGTEVSVSASPDESEAHKVVRDRLERIRDRVVKGEVVEPPADAGPAEPSLTETAAITAYDPAVGGVE